MADIWSKYIEILTDPAHTFVEFTFVLFIDVLLLGVVWPLIKRHIHRDIAQAHQDRDAHHGHDQQSADEDPLQPYEGWQQDYRDWERAYYQDWQQAYQGKNGEGL